jgi:hypothetical protein
MKNKTEKEKESVQTWPAGKHNVVSFTDSFSSSINCKIACFFFYLGVLRVCMIIFLVFYMHGFVSPYKTWSLSCSTTSVLRLTLSLYRVLWCLLYKLTPQIHNVHMTGTMFVLFYCLQNGWVGLIRYLKFWNISSCYFL